MASALAQPLPLWWPASTGPSSGLPWSPWTRLVPLSSHPGPNVGLWPLQAQNIFNSASRGPPTPSGRVYGPGFHPYLAATSVDSCSAHIPSAFVGPKVQALDSGSPGPLSSCLKLASPSSAPALLVRLQATDVLEWTSAGPTLAYSHWPQQAQATGQGPAFPLAPHMGAKRPHAGLCSASSCLRMAPRGPTPASYGPLWVTQSLPSSRRPPQAQLLLLATSTGPRPASPQPLLAWLLASSPRPFLCWPEAASVALTSPATDRQWPLRTQLWTPRNLTMPSCCLLATCPGQHPACLPACPPTASKGPWPPSTWPVEAHLVPPENLSGHSSPFLLSGLQSWPTSSLAPASLGPADASRGLSRLASASWRPAPPGPASTSQWALQAQLLASPGPPLSPSAYPYGHQYPPAQPPAIPWPPLYLGWCSRLPFRAQRWPSDLLSRPRTSSHLPLGAQRPYPAESTGPQSGLTSQLFRDLLCPDPGGFLGPKAQGLDSGCPGPHSSGLTLATPISGPGLPEFLQHPDVIMLTSAGAALASSC
ncbi:hypothetical protein AAY473_036146 [Plecturocebus cupreus]